MHNSIFFEKSHPSKPWVGSSNPSWITKNIPRKAYALRGFHFSLYHWGGIFSYVPTIYIVALPLASISPSSL